MTIYYKRLWNVEVGGKEFISSRTDGYSFRCRFEISINPGDTTSIGDFSFYNLADDTITRVFRKGEYFRFRAGYENNIDTIFYGQIRNAFKERDGASIVTRVLCSTNVTAEQRGTINNSLGAGCRVYDIILALAKMIPAYPIIDEDQFSDIPVYARGYVMNGDVVTMLDSLSHAHDFSYVIVGNRLVVTRNGKTRKTVLHTISQFTGMEGIPELTGGENAVGCDVSMRLDPKYQVNDRFKLDTEFKSFNTGNLYLTNAPDVKELGEYNINSIQISGDTHGSQWTTRLEGIKAGAINTNQTNSVTSINYGRAVDQDFRAKVRSVAAQLKINPDWLMAIMAFETGRTFDPATRNKAGSSATGLIQFTSATAIGLGTTTAQLARMTQVEQMDYVYKYFLPYASRCKSLIDTYMAVLYPSAIGKANDYVLFSSPSIAYTQNAGLDPSHLGYITKQMAAAPVFDELRRGRNYEN